MSDILDEISYDLQNEKQDRLISKVVRIFLGACVIILISVAIYSWKDKTSTNLQIELSNIFNNALVAADKNNFEEAISLFDQIIANSSQEYAALAYLQKAQVLIKQDNFDAAQKTLLSMSAEKHFDLALRELAEQTYLANQIAFNKISDEKKNEEIFDKLTKNDKPWKILVTQIRAMYLLNKSDISNAKSTIESINNDSNSGVSANLLTSSILSAVNSNK